MEGRRLLLIWLINVKYVWARLTSLKRKTTINVAERGVVAVCVYYSTVIFLITMTHKQYVLWH